MKTLFAALLLTACVGCFSGKDKAVAPTAKPAQDIRATMEHNTVIMNQMIALQDRLAGNYSRELFYENAGLGDIAPETTSELQAKIATEEKEFIARRKEPEVHACFTTTIPGTALKAAISAGQLTLGEVQTYDETMRSYSVSAHAATEQATRYHAIHGYSKATQ